MNKHIVWLAGLLALQLVALVAVVGSGPNLPAVGESRLLDVARPEIKELGLEDRAGGTSLVLKRATDGWVLQADPAQAPLAADANKVEGVIDQLLGLDGSWPVGSTNATIERFEVADDNYQRQVQLVSDSGTTTLMLGTSPSFQKVHARVSGQDHVYSVKLASYELDTAVDTWLKKDLLALGNTPQKIAVDDKELDVRQTLEGSGDSWRLDGESVDTTQANSYANRFPALLVLGEATSDQVQRATVAGRVVADETAFEVLKVMSAEVTTGVVDTPSTVETWLLRREDVSDRLFRVASYVAEQLLMRDAEFAPAVDEKAANPSQDASNS